MAFVTADRVTDTSSTTGTGSVTLANTPPTGYRSFASVLTVNDTFYYCIQSQTIGEWETGVGTYSGENVFDRTTVLASSNSGAKVSFASGTKNVFLTLAAAKTIQSDPNGVVTLDTLHLTNSLGAAYGGTGLTSPGATGNVLTSTGTSWASQPSTAPALNILNYGADKTGVADSASAFNAALAAGTAGGVPFIIYFPAGTYKFNSAISYTMPNPATGALQTNAFFAVSLVGEGADVTILKWGSTDGLTFTFGSSQHCIHIKDMTFATTGQNNGNGLTLLNSYGYFGTFVAQSDLTNVTFRGFDGYGLVYYWAKCVSVNQVNDITFINCNFYGVGAFYGTGVYLNSPGAGTFVPCTSLPNYFTLGSVYNFTNCNFSFLGLGLYYGENIQTVQVTASFFAQCTNSISCPAGIYNNSNQGLIVSDSTFFGYGNVIVINSPLNNIQILNNFIGVNVSCYGIFIQPDVDATIVGNQFVPYAGANTASGGIAIQGYASGSVQSIDSLTVGSGYSVGATASVSGGGGGTGLSVQVAAINATGGITRLTISNRGTGYVSTPTLTFPTGTGATFRVNLVGVSPVTIDGNTFTSVTNGIILDTYSTSVKVGIGNTFVAGLTNNVLNAGASNIASLAYDTSGLKVIDKTGSIGYGTGAGSSVTQITSKSTAVTINAPTGQITTSNAALAAGASAAFTVNNSKIAATDVVVVSNGNGNYTTNVYGTGTGSFVIRLTNISGVSLSDAVSINFAVIRGSGS